LKFAASLSASWTGDADMTNGTRAGIALIVLVHALAGCDAGGPAPPTGPTPIARDEATSSPGSIRMKGTVSDTAFRKLPGARVEIQNGPHAGASTTVDGSGEFSFSGMFDETTQFRATSEGHGASVKTLQPFCERCNPNWWINFTLDVLDPPVTVAGTYTLTIISGACAMLPSDARSRTFTATIPQDMTPAPVPGGAVVVAIASATVLSGWDTIVVGVAGDYLAFWLETLVEQLAPNRYLMFSGQAAGPVDSSDPARIVLPFAGTIEDCTTRSEGAPFMDCHRSQAATRTTCTSFDHQFVLTRR
jgi:hypothetical protein